MQYEREQHGIRANQRSKAGNEEHKRGVYRAGGGSADANKRGTRGANAARRGRIGLREPVGVGCARRAPDARRHRAPDARLRGTLAKRAHALLRQVRRPTEDRRILHAFQRTGNRQCASK